MEEMIAKLQEALRIAEAKLAAHAQLISEFTAANLNLKAALHLTQPQPQNSAPSAQVPAPAASAPVDSAPDTTETTAAA